MTGHDASCAARIAQSQGRRLGLVLVLGAWLWFAGPLLWSPGNLYLLDTGMQDVPVRLHAAKLLRGGALPHWTTLLCCGWSPLGEGQAGILYPGFLAYVAHPVPKTHDVFMAAHWLLLACTSYGWLLAEGAQPRAAALGAVALMASPTLQYSHVVPTGVATASWFSLALWQQRRWQTGRPRAWIALALANTMMLLTGFPQLALALITVQVLLALVGALVPSVTGFGAWDTDDDSPRRGSGLGQVCRSLLVLIVVPALLSAPQLLPTYRFSQESSRSEGYSWDNFLWTTVPWSQLHRLGIPELEETPRLGPDPDLRPVYWLLTASLAAWGLWQPGNPRRFFWVALLVTGVLLAAGSPLLRLVWLLPPYNWFRWHAVYLIPSLWAGGWLLARGADDVLRRYPWAKSGRGLRGCTATLVWVAAAWLLASHDMGHFLSTGKFYQQTDPALAALASQPQHARLWPLEEAHAEGARLLRYSEAQMARTAATAPADYNLLAEIPSARVIHQHDTSAPREITELLLHEEQYRPGTVYRLRTAGVTWLSSRQPLEGDWLSACEQAAGPPVWQYRIERPLPRAWPVYQVETINDWQQRLDRLGQMEFDPTLAAIVEREQPNLPGSASWPSACRLARAAASELEIESDTDAEAVLVVCDQRAANWRAWIDGNPAPLFAVNHAFRGLRLARGRHHIQMRYWPREFLLGWLISGISMAGLLVPLWPTGTSRVRRAGLLALWTTCGLGSLTAGWLLLRGPVAPRLAASSLTASAPSQPNPDHFTAEGWSIQPAPGVGIRALRNSAVAGTIAVGPLAESGWQVELNRIALPLAASERYQVALEARSSAGSKLCFGVRSSSAGKLDPPCDRCLELAEPWQRWTADFTASQDEPDANLWVQCSGPSKLRPPRLEHQGIEVDVARAWYLRCWRRVSLSSEQNSVLRFRASADGNRTVLVELLSADGNERPLGLHREIHLTREGDEFSFPLTPANGTGDALVRFGWTSHAADLTISDVRVESEQPSEAARRWLSGAWSLWPEEVASQASIKHAAETEPGYVRVALPERPATDRAEMILFGPNVVPDETGVVELTLSARAKSPRQLAPGWSLAQPPWTYLGAATPIHLETDWKRFRVGLVNGSPDTPMRLQFNLGLDPTGFELDELKIQSIDWRLSAVPAGSARLVKPLEAGGRVRIERDPAPGLAAGEVELERSFRLEPGEPYGRLSFRARASEPGELNVEVRESRTPSRRQGVAHRVPLQPRWQTFQLSFACDSPQDELELVFALTGRATTVELDDVLFGPAVPANGPRTSRELP